MCVRSMYNYILLFSTRHPEPVKNCYLIVNTFDSDIMVHAETRRREAISFVRMGQGPRRDVNPSLCKTIHFIHILKGDEVENELGNRKK